jgi:hypothetical protein
MRRIAELGVSAGVGFHEGGGVGAAIGTGAAMVLDHAVTAAETQMRTLMAGAVLDSRVATDLLKNATVNPRTLSPQTRKLFLSLAVNLPLRFNDDTTTRKNGVPPNLGILATR